MTAAAANGSAPAEGSRAVVWGLLVAAVLFFAVDLVLYYRIDAFLAYGVSYLLDPERSIGAVLRGLGGHTYYPPLYYAFTGVAGVLLGHDFVGVVFANALFLPLAAIYLTLLGRRLGMKTYAFLPGVLLLLAPGSYLASRELTIEAPLVLFVPAFAYHMLASDGLRARGHVLAAGVWAGLAMLTKWTFPAYACGVFAFAVARMLRANGPQAGDPPARGRWANLALLIGVAAAVAGWWYAARMDWATFAASSRNDPSHPTYSYVREFADYLGHLRRVLAGTRAAPVLAVAAIGLALSRRPLAFAGAAVLGVLTPLAILAVPVHGETRYALPLVPAGCLVLAMAAAFARWEAARLGVAIALVGLTAHGRFAYMESPEHGLMTASEAGRIARLLDERLPRGAAGPLRVAVHPIWRNPHMRCDFLQYHVDRRGASGRLRLICASGVEYGRYREKLRAGELAAVIADCGPADRCMETGTERLDRVVRVLATTGHVNQMTGQVSAKITREDVEADWDLLRRDFVPAYALPFEDGTYTRIWARRGLLAETRGATP